MNTATTHSNVTGDIESSEQLLTLIHTQAGTLIQTVLMDQACNDSCATLERTIAEWAETHGTTENVSEVEEKIEEAIDAWLPKITDPRRPMIKLIFYRVMAEGFMKTIESLRGNDATSTATPAIQKATTETLGVVFSSGWGDTVPQATVKPDEFTLTGVRIDEL